MNVTSYKQSKPAPSTQSKWSNLNSDLYSADSKARSENMALQEVSGFAYVNSLGRVQYTFAPYPIYEPGTRYVACIVENVSNSLDELAPIEIGD